ncbi:MAG TPA: right-handed parallel beta-helix repeat-containing protein [Candidatus Paceibacterota bacterium]|nr:right-handed parallel beta-helix repeat-containing protein [Candidatus Paceibacterota bacterium]
MYRRGIGFLIIYLLIITNFAVFNGKVFSYSGEPTHYNLAKEMIRLYNLAYDPDILDDKVKWILQGSIDEDILPRSAFHLYDPIYNRAPFGFDTAKEWAIDSKIQGSAIHRFANLFLNLFGVSEFKQHGDYSWTANVNNLVEEKEREALYGLGHILHLIADMTVPAHSRNDHHLTGDPLEIWLKENLKLEDYFYAEKLYNSGYKPADLYSLSQAMDILAKYSNKYFFSKDSIFDEDYKNPKILFEKQEDWEKINQRTYAWTEDERGDLFRLVQVRKNLIRNEKQYSIFDDDYNLGKDYFTRLAPKAIQYGAGVIKLFVEDVEWEKEKLAWQGAGQVDENLPTPLPRPKPSRFPIFADIIKPVDLSPETSANEEVPLDVPLNNPLETPGEVKGEEKSKEDQGDDKGNQEEQNVPIVVQSPFYSTGSGGSNHNLTPQEPETPSLPPLPPAPPISSPLHLIINEIQVRDNEFVELYNPTSSSFNLTGHYFSYYSSARNWNDPYRNQEFPASASVPTNGYYLIGLEGYPASSGNPDADWQPYGSNQLSNSNGSIAIFPFDPKTKTTSESQAGAIDATAWGDVDFIKEGMEFQTALGADKSMQRINFQDNGDNNTDFEYKKIPTPKNSLNQTRINGTIIADDTIISVDTTWTIAGSPYYIESNSSQWPIVESGITLTIEPGVKIYPQNANYTFLEIRGTLKAEGTASDKIVIAPEAIGNYVSNIIFTSTSTNSILDHVSFSYGGKKGEAIKVDSASIEIKNSIVENSFKNGIYLKDSNSEIKNTEIKNNQNSGIVIEGIGSAPEISDCQINDNQLYGIEIKDWANPQIKDNTFSGNLISAVYLKSAYPEFSNNTANSNFLNGILVDSHTIISQNTSWQNDLVYILKSNSGDYVTVDEGMTLTIEPGAIIKPASSYYTALLVKGTLKVEAVSGSEVVFTSINDDSFGGDTNNDGNATTPIDSDWKKIKFETTSTGSVFDHVFMYYGTGIPPIELVGSASVDIKDTVSYAP